MHAVSENEQHRACRIGKYLLPRAVLPQRRSVAHLKGHVALQSSGQVAALELEGQPSGQVKCDDVHLQGLASLQGDWQMLSAIPEASVLIIKAASTQIINLCNYTKVSHKGYV